MEVSHTTLKLIFYQGHGYCFLIKRCCPMTLFWITDRQLKVVSYMICEVKGSNCAFLHSYFEQLIIYLDVFTQCFEAAQRESVWRRLIKCNNLKKKTNGLQSLFLCMLNLFLVVYCLIKETVLSFTWFVFVYKICTLYFMDNENTCITIEIKNKVTFLTIL